MVSSLCVACWSRSGGVMDSKRRQETPYQIVASASNRLAAEEIRNVGMQLKRMDEKIL